MIKVNGEMLDINNILLSDYISGTDYDIKRIAVEKNGEIVSKALYESTLLVDGDVIEVVSFVGGG